MRFKLDENIDIGAVAVFEQAGHDVATVTGQDMGGATDALVAQAVNTGGRILVTFDRGLATFVPIRQARTPASSCCGCATKP